MVGEGFDVKCAGFLVAKELDNFSKVLDNPTRPVLAILGGAKVIIFSSPSHSVRTGLLWLGLNGLLFFWSGV